MAEEIAVVCDLDKKTENSPKLLINGEECAACSDHDIAASSNSEEENDQKLSFRSNSPCDSHSENEAKGHHGEFQPPNDELKARIKSQVEFYLSDDNLARDAFLLKHVRRNKEGYVNLKLITSFKKVKSLTKDYRVVAESLKDSTMLSMNDENTKVKRNEPLRAELMDRNPGRTVVATNIENPSFEHVSEMFSKCGEIVLIRIIRGGKTIPPDLKEYESKFPENETFAVIEFETMAAAARACSELTQDGGIRVIELGKGAKKKDKKLRSRELDNDSVPESDEEHEEKKKKKRNRGKKNKNKRLSELAGTSDDSHNSSCSESDSSTHNSFSSCRRRYHSNPGLSSNSHNRTEPPGINGQWRSPQSSPEPQRRHFNSPSPNKEASSSAPNSPWSQRRKTTSSKPGGHSPLVDREPVKHRMVQLEGVERLPRGPDGTKGFHGFGRGQPMIAVA
ncbi:la-related protein 6 [Nematostella vectensis]|uniref:la-related protein 6 n=1 Tax=Nematostella vectensis TaxID=45351 RepID=UPI00207782E7|nr:la-related protein 6 [Nematostella vectensis]